MEAGFNGDTDRAIGFFYEVKQHRSQLVPGYVTAMLDFVEDPISYYKLLCPGGAGRAGLLLSSCPCRAVYLAGL